MHSVPRRLGRAAVLLRRQRVRDRRLRIPRQAASGGTLQDTISQFNKNSSLTNDS